MRLVGRVELDMNDPKNQMKEYLEKLIFRFLRIKSLYNQVKIIYSWKKPIRNSAFETGSYFYNLTLYSFNRSIVLELYKLTSKREDKSLFDWLDKAKTHVKSLEPSNYSPKKGTREILNSNKYKSLIDDQIEEINNHRSTIDTLKIRRDKDIAHSDSTYFSDPEKLSAMFPLNKIDIEKLMETISSILHKQHTLIFHSDLTMNISSLHNVDSVLIATRAFNRVWKDKHLTRELGVQVNKYRKDDYEERE